MKSQITLKRKLRFLVLISMIFPFSITVKAVDPSPTNLFVNGITYYVSNSGSDANDGRSPSTAWQSIDKVNASMNQFNPGDKIVFKRGQTFYGTLYINTSGNPGNYITFGSYDQGNLPQIRASASINNWSRLNGNIWKASCTNCPSRLNNLYINNKPIPIGRYPNRDAGNDGYLTIDGNGSQNHLTDNDLPASPNWSGAEVVIRTTRWTMDRVKVDSHNGNTLTFAQSTSYSASANFGYFLVNHPQTLDKNSEWSYDNERREILIYLDNKDPNTLDIEYSQKENSISLNQANYIKIENLSLQNSNDKVVNANNSNNLIFVDNEIIGAGLDGGIFIGCNNLIFSRNLVRNTNNNALEFLYGSNARISGNNIENTALIPGMGKNGDLQYKAVFLVGAQSSFHNNRIDSAGYLGIRFEGDYVTVENNFISNFCLTMDDGSGIYTWGDGRVYNGRRIVGNIVLYGYGASLGTSYPNFKAAEGIYVDDRSANVEIKQNTVAFCSGAGIYIHNSNDIDIQENLIYSNHLGLRMTHDNIAASHPIYNCKVLNNVFVAADEDQKILELRSIRDDILNFGEFNYNRYCSPFKLSEIISIDKVDYQWRRFSLNDWKQFSNKDADTQGSPVQYDNVYQEMGVPGPNKISNSNFDVGIATWQCWSNNTNCSNAWDAQSPLDGGALKIDFSNAEPGSYSWATVPIGEVERNATYKISFDVKGSTNNASVGVRMRQHQNPYQELSDKRTFAINANRQSFETILNSSGDFGYARIEFEVNVGDNPVWIDNVSVQKIEASTLSENDFFQFEYNSDTVSRSVFVERTSLGVNGESICRDEVIRLDPFASFLTFRNFQISSQEVYRDTNNLNLRLNLGTTCDWNHINENNQTVVSINQNNQSLGQTQLELYQHSGNIPSFEQRSVLGRNWVLQFNNSPQEPYTGRFYFTNEDWDEFRTRSHSVNGFEDLSLVVFNSNDDSKENGRTDDNTDGATYEIPNSLLEFNTHQGGYYVEVSLLNPGEIWLIENSENGTFPVILNSFSLRPNPISIEVLWESSVEVNSSHYEIERSLDGLIFQRVGSVEAKGNSSSRSIYQFEDSQVQRDQDYYYRLKMVDKDGSFEYSRIQKARLENSSGFRLKIYPNPVDDELHLDMKFLEPTFYIVKIFNSVGKELFNHSTSSLSVHNELDINVSQWSPGIYYILVEGLDEQKSLQFIKR